MEIKSNPTLEPLINDLNAIHIGYYLKDNQFKKLCVRNNIEGIWSQAFKIAKDSRTYFSFDLDHEPFDCQDALILLFNHYYLNDKTKFYDFAYLIITNFIHWSKDKFDVRPIIEDFEILKFPDIYIREFKELNKKAGY